MEALVEKLCNRFSGVTGIIFFPLKILNTFYNQFPAVACQSLEEQLHKLPPKIV